MLELFRLAVFAVFAAAVAVAVAAWAVQTRRIHPFGRAGQLIRRLTDPLLDPVEAVVLRRGGNPQHAGWWLVGITVVGGILAITLAEWLAVETQRLRGAAAGGARGTLRVAVYYAGQIVSLALIVRVVGSWFGVGRFTRWMRPAYTLTDWIVRPLSRIIPPFGMIDITPLVAWLVVQLATGLVLRVI